MVLESSQTAPTVVVGDVPNGNNDESSLLLTAVIFLIPDKLESLPGIGWSLLTLEPPLPIVADCDPGNIVAEGLKPPSAVAVCLSGMLTRADFLITGVAKLVIVVLSTLATSPAATLD